jgi:hypothetical protein
MAMLVWWLAIPTPRGVEHAVTVGGHAPRHSKRGVALRLFSALSVAAAFGLGAYALLEATRPNNGLVSFSFLLVLPAAVTAFVAYVVDPWGERSFAQYLAIPFWLALVVVGLSIAVLREGVICVLILSPLWLGSGMVGSAITYRIMQMLHDGRRYCTALLVLPLAAMQIEPAIPLPETTVTVTRSIVIAAEASAIWKLLRGIPDVHPGEGRWNISQDVIGVPRPIGARLVGEGIGAERLAVWGHNISFKERITAWQPGVRIGWRFIFDNMDGWGYTDRHLLPKSAYFRVVEGGYRMVPLGAHRTRIILDTGYWIRTPVNAYSALWGELFLGDLENNLLALVKQRAEVPVGN